MADITLSGFKNALADGARPNRFWVAITSPSGATSAIWNDPAMGFLVKSFSLPAKTIGDIVVNFQGMQTKLAGDPTFDDASMVLHNDVAFSVKKFFQAWMEAIANTGGADGSTQVDGTNVRLAPAAYKTDITVTQLDRTGSALATYILHGAYPKTMDAIELSMESSDTLEEMSISFAYDTFTVTTGSPS